MVHHHVPIVEERAKLTAAAERAEEEAKSPALESGKKMDLKRPQ